MVRSTHGFFYGREPLNLPDLGIDIPGGLRDYPDPACTIAVVVSSGKATYRDCAEFLNLQDLYFILDTLEIDNFNQALLNKRRKDQ